MPTQTQPIDYNFAVPHCGRGSRPPTATNCRGSGSRAWGRRRSKTKSCWPWHWGRGIAGGTCWTWPRASSRIIPRNRWWTWSLGQLSRIKGLGKAKAGVLVATFELARRGLHKGLGVRPVISAPGDALSMLSDIKDQQREHFLCLYLNARNQVIHKEVVSIGSLSSAIVHPREVFRTAVAQAAASVILAHNHPSGDVSPSQDDINLTRRLVQAGEIMGIDVLDHLIIGSDDFISLKERGLI